ncbi:MAG TPA: DsbE family thiol:disulfide interchange protein [Burkholderiales bacterium]
MTKLSAAISRAHAWLPLSAFVTLVGVLGVGLTLNDRDVPSPLVGKAAPAFELPQLHRPSDTFAPREMLGKVWLLNVWASWCTSCREEHVALLELARSAAVPVYGLNYKDTRQDAIAWLGNAGDPFVLSAYDPKGRIAIDYGVYGTPETYAIDKRGVIRYKHVGPLTPQIIQQQILPLADELNRQ